MTNKQYGEQPFTETQSGLFYSGMTRREYFAGLAMQGMLSNHSLIDSEYDYETLMAEAVKQSDALISQLNQQKEPNDR